MKQLLHWKVGIGVAFLLTFVSIWKAQVLTAQWVLNNNDDHSFQEMKEPWKETVVGEGFNTTDIHKVGAEITENVAWNKSINVATNNNYPIPRMSLKTSPKSRPKLDNKNINRFIIVPEHKLLFCYIEKTGCAMFNHLWRMVRLMHPSMRRKKAVGYQVKSPWGRNNPKVHKLSVTDLEDMLANSEWTKAVFYRDPALRLLSAFRSKCGGHDKDGKGQCQNIFGPNLTDTPEDFQKAIDRLPESALVLKNPHVAPVATFCGGLNQTLDYYDFVQPLRPRTAPELVRQLLLQIGVDTNATEYLVENVVKTGGTNWKGDKELIFKLLKLPLGYSETMRQHHNTASSLGRTIQDYFQTTERLQRVQEVYGQDYELLQLKTLDLENLMASVKV